MTILDSDLYASPHRDDSPAQAAARTLIEWADTASLGDQTAALDRASLTDEKRIASIELPCDPAAIDSAPATVELTIDELTGSTETARLILEHPPEGQLIVDLASTSRLAAFARRSLTEGA